MDTQSMQNWTVGTSFSEFNQSSGEYTPPDQGFYTFQLIKKDEDQLEENTFNKGAKPRLRTKLHFQIVGPPGNKFVGEVVRQKYTVSLNEKAALLPVVKALIGRPLQPTDRIGWEDGTWTAPDGKTYDVVGIGGKYMQATLTHAQGADGRVWPNLVGMIPVGADFVPPDNEATSGKNVPF